VHATYTGDGGKEHQVFSVVPVHGETVEQVWKRFGSRWITLEVDGAPVRARKVPYRGLVGVKRTDSGIVGVSDAANKEELLARLKGL
jgi:hypothetical protein